MKILVTLLISLLSLNVFADGSGEVLPLTYQTQDKIIQALIESDEAKNSEVDGTSYRDVMAIMVASARSEFFVKGSDISLTLTCTKLADRIAKCSLDYHAQDGENQSAINITGNVYFPDFSTEVFVSEVTTAIAG